MDVVSTLIRSEISLFDEAVREAQAQVDDARENDEIGSEEPSLTPRVLHGSIRPTCTLAELALAHTDDPAFTRVRAKLSAALAKKLKIQRANIQNVDTVSTITMSSISNLQAELIQISLNRSFLISLSKHTSRLSLTGAWNQTSSGQIQSFTTSQDMILPW